MRSSSRYRLETDPHGLSDLVPLDALPVGRHVIDIAGLVEPFLDRHAEAILAHLWMTGGGAQLLGARLQHLASHATLVANAGSRTRWATTASAATSRS